MFWTKFRDREKKIRKMRPRRVWTVVLISTGLLILGANGPAVWAEEELPFDIAKLYFELNDTDGDLGIHGLVDGEAWKELEIEDKRGRKILDIEVRRRLGRQGLTELFFESAEPPFLPEEEGDVFLPPEVFFKRFPQGWYEIEGETLEGDELESEVWLSHAMPAPAVVRLNGDDLTTADSDLCDEEEPDEVSAVLIEWEQVDSTHPAIGTPNNEPIEVVFYQVVVEWEDEDENVFVFNAEYSEAGSVVVPDGFLPDEAEFKIEVLVRAANGNQTAVESCPLVFVAP